MKTRPTIIVFADLVGYSALVEKDQGEAIAVIRALRMEYLEPSVDAHGGAVPKRLGDGWLPSFSGVIPAVDCASVRARAANLYYKLTVGDWEHGLRMMERAVKPSPLDGVALSMPAEAEIMLYSARYKDPPPAVVKRMQQDLDLAVEQVPRSDYVPWTRGYLRIHYLDDLAGAEADLRRATDLNPAFLENYELRAHIDI